MNKELEQFYDKHSGRSDRDFTMSEETSKRVKENIFSRLGTVTVEPEPVSFGSKLHAILLKGYVLAPLVVLLFVSGTAYASADALPGDTLYTVKRHVESARILIAPTDEAKLELEERFTQKRVEEVERLNEKIPASGSKRGSAKVDVTVTDENESEDNEDESDKRRDDARTSEQPDAKTRERREKAREEAVKAIERLNGSRQKWEDKGRSEKAQEIDRKVNEFRNKLEGRVEQRNDDSRRRTDFQNIRF